MVNRSVELGVPIAPLNATAPGCCSARNSGGDSLQLSQHVQIKHIG